MIKKIVVANRGEIALRIMRTIRKLGLSSVAVYSDIDRGAPHVKYADEAIHIGASEPSASYLNSKKIIKACMLTGADAVHPGYGFLSENAHFARALEEAGIILIGPSPEAMEIMGSKLAAKDAVKQFDIPMVPGTDTAITDHTEAKRIAESIGFPILVKASAGGGGKGMRIVENAAEFEEQLARATSEALSAFGDGSVFIEKYVSSPRHIEIQIMADNYGNTVYLFERECSIQRRHQKVVEEAPSAVLSESLRKAMGEAAVRVAQACQYSGAGTVEFLLDDKHNFYFLEMNTRLQVEHPVTEMITGLDLVELQIRVANEEELPIKQEDLTIHGHAIELRVYAEDPLNNFLPSIGKLIQYERPIGEGIRVDDGYEEGMDIPIYYDPMIAKLVAHGPNRMAAIARLKKAIDQYHISGVENTLAFGRFVLNHPDFVSGDFDTHFVKQHFTPEAIKAAENENHELAAKLALYAYLKKQRALKLPKHEDTNWNR